jgi:hypothetical protein
MLSPTKNSCRGCAMTAAPIIQFPPRRRTAILMICADDGGWLILAGAHAWLHGDYAAALADARCLAQNLALPIRSAA